MSKVKRFSKKSSRKNGDVTLSLDEQKRAVVEADNKERAKRRVQFIHAMKQLEIDYNCKTVPLPEYFQRSDGTWVTRILVDGFALPGGMGKKK